MTSILLFQSREAPKRPGLREGSNVAVFYKDIILARVRNMSKVTAKLQVTIPKAVADKYGIRPGSEIRWLAAGDGVRVELSEKVSRPGLPLQKRLALFDRMTKRLEKLPPVRSVADSESRGWTRVSLYTDRLRKYARPR